MEGKMECAFKVLQHNDDGKKLKYMGSSDNNTMNNDGGSGMNVDDIQLPTTQTKTLPFLESTLEYELNTRTEALSSSSTITAEGTKKQSTEAKISWRTLTFDILYQKLVKFKNDKGHVSPPFKHVELGRWVSELRANKKMLRERGLEFEQPLVDDDGTTNNTDTAAVATTAVGKTEETLTTGGEVEPPPKKKQKREKKATSPTSNTYLSSTRVQQLDSIGFIWSVIINRATWNEIFEELKQFKLNNGRFPTNKEGTIGNWLKNQRKLFSTEDVEFMTNKKSKFEEIGCPLRQRTYVALSWDDRFQQLVEYGRIAGGLEDDKVELAYPIPTSLIPEFDNEGIATTYPNYDSCACYYPGEAWMELADIVLAPPDCTTLDKEACKEGVGAQTCKWTNNRGCVDV